MRATKPFQSQSNSHSPGRRQCAGNCNDNWTGAISLIERIDSPTTKQLAYLAIEFKDSICVPIIIRVNKQFDPNDRFSLRMNAILDQQQPEFKPVFNLYVGDESVSKCTCGPVGCFKDSDVTKPFNEGFNTFHYEEKEHLVSAIYYVGTNANPTPAKLAGSDLKLRNAHNSTEFSISVHDWQNQLTITSTVKSGLDLMEEMASPKLAGKRSHEEI